VVTLQNTARGELACAILSSSRLSSRAGEDLPEFSPLAVQQALAQRSSYLLRHSALKSTFRLVFV